MNKNSYLVLPLIVLLSACGGDNDGGNEGGASSGSSSSSNSSSSTSSSGSSSSSASSSSSSSSTGTVTNPGVQFHSNCPSQPTPTQTVQLSANEETLTVGAEPSSGSNKTNTGMIIRAGEVFDGNNTRYNLSGGSQAEGQPSLFALEDGATIRNVVIGNLAADGIHCYGDCLIENVWWEDIGEDAATAKGPEGSLMHVNCGGAFKGDDKTFQHNGRGHVTITNFVATDAGKLYRSCGDCTNNGGPRIVTIDNVNVKNVDTIVGINPNFGDQAYISDLTVDYDGTHKIKICQVYIGKVKGQSTPAADYKSGTVQFETQACSVSPSNVTILGDETRINLNDYEGMAEPKRG